ncbi:Trk K+ transport system NAD-binding subunit [Streptomyces sp. V4I2]|nr:Trk K+ transport system NAD-binding subunit [Streptomyces sp. V4I2]
MKVVIAGGHGKVALLLEQLLSRRGDVVTGLIRNPAQAEALEEAGPRPGSWIWRRPPPTRSPGI